MEYADLESYEGVYDVYYTEGGERLIVLEGLDVEQPIEPYPAQTYLLPRVEKLEFFYWTLLVCVTVYLIGMYIIRPLIARYRSSSTSFERQ